jgi:hypothetical protein
MMTNHQRLDANPRVFGEKLRRLARLVIIALIVIAGLAAYILLPLWLTLRTPRWLIRGASVAFLWTMLAVYVPAVVAVCIGGVWSSRAAVRAWRRHDLAGLGRNLRWMLLVTSCLVALIATEFVSSARLLSLRRLPVLPTQFAKPSNRFSPGSHADDAALKHRRKAGEPRLETATPDGLYLVVVGESSARGSPYDPWLSVGQIVGWQLEQVFPGRKILVDVQAEGGICLEQAVLPLCELERHPDAIIVLAGHNEFQSRYGWSRNVSHYIEEGAKNPLAWLDLARSTSGTAGLILNTLDRYYGEAPPPPRVVRTLVDHPVCHPREYAFLREDFQLRLDSLTEYCTRIGSLPILIVPGSNDGSFDPNRSVLAASTPADARAAFEREFNVVREAESKDTEGSIAAYRRLVKQHPEFAETHYRLARLLAASGAWDEARRHFVLARDLDGLPLRCPTDFQEAYRAVARRYGAVLIDGPEVLSRMSPHGILDDHLFHDGQHVNLIGIVALSNEVLQQLQRRRAFGWPESLPAPHIELETCARHFELDAQKWATVFERTATFYARTAYVRFNPSERLRLADQNYQASLDLATGRPLRDPSLPSLMMAVSSFLAGHHRPDPLARPSADLSPAGEPVKTTGLRRTDLTSQSR